MRTWVLGFLCGLLLWTALGVGAVLWFAAHDKPTLYRFCNGHLEAVEHVTPCPDGSLRMVA